MIYNIPQPEISPAFTIEDIHKIREWNYERMKDATAEERRAYYRGVSDEAEKRITKIRKQREITLTV